MLPFTMPSADVLFASAKRVFAHYFYPFPLSIDNKPAAVDYYQTQYLAPGGEGNIHLPYGGYLRARPLATPTVSAGFLAANMQAEVKMAIARGITGFTFDILNLTDAMSGTGKLATLLAAAQAVDPRFWIVPMLDMSAMTGLSITQAVALISSFTEPSIARLPDGRILLSAFDAALQPLAWWQNVLSRLNAIDVDVAFVPVLLGAPATNPLAAVSHGYGGWGTATPNASSAGAPCLMMPVLAQQFRPKNQLFWEAQNTASFRAGWAAAIAAGAQYVQIVTWSDFSESGQVQPYTDVTLNPAIGSGFYDLTAYYATWFATGVQPPITRDVLYWCYRRMNSKVAHPSQADGFNVIGSPEMLDIELLAFLSAPGTLKINGSPLAAAAGITSFRVTATPGNPQFNLERDGSDVFEFKGPVTIYGPAGSPAGTLDLTYWCGSHSAAGGSA
jgi:hypothetical protein